MYPPTPPDTTEVSAEIPAEPLAASRTDGDDDCGCVGVLLDGLPLVSKPLPLAAGTDVGLTL